MPTLQEFIDKAVVQAKIGADAQSVVTRNELAALSMLSQVFQDVTLGYAGDIRSLPRLAKTLTFTNGVAALSSDVLTGSMADATLYDPDDPTKEYAFVPEWDDFIRVYDTRIGHFTVRNNTSVYVIEPGATYDDGDGLDDTLTLVVSGVPAIPATASTAIDAPAEFLNAALNLLVERLRGATP